MKFVKLKLNRRSLLAGAKSEVVMVPRAVDERMMESRDERTNADDRRARVLSWRGG